MTMTLVQHFYFYYVWNILEVSSLLHCRLSRIRSCEINLVRDLFGDKAAILNSIILKSYYETLRVQICRAYVHDDVMAAIQ